MGTHFWNCNEGDHLPERGQAPFAVLAVIVEVDLDDRVDQ